jgi:hypothetical protein
MPINLTYDEFFKRTQPERVGESDERPPSPMDIDDGEIIEPDDYLYDEDTYQMVEHEKPEDGEFFDAPLSVQGADRRRAFGLSDVFSDTTDDIHPDVKEHVNEYLKRGENLSPEEMEIVKQHDTLYRNKHAYDDILSKYFQEPAAEHLPDAVDRPEQTFLRRHNMAVNKTKITELLIDSYFAYDNEGEPEHNSTVIDSKKTGATVEIYHKEGYDVVAFRGTDSTQDLIEDIDTFSTKLSAYFPFIKPENDLTAHSGFVKDVASVYEAVKNNIRSPIYDGTGHSLGSANVQIFAYVYFQDTGIRPRHLITFGSPRVFIDTAETPTSRYDLAIDHLRIMNTNDMITYLPTHDSAFMGATKFATEGSILGAQFGQYGGPAGASLGAAVGSAVGGLVGGMASGGYKHVGVGLLLAPVKNAVVNIEGKQEILKNKNYYILPEGVDLARNPIEFDSSFAQGIAGRLIYSTANNYITNALKEGTAFAGVAPSNVLKEFKTMFDIHFFDEIEKDVLDIVSKSRGAKNQVGRPFFDMHNDNDAGNMIKSAESYLTGKFLEDFEADTKEIRDMKIDLRRSFREKSGGTLGPLEQFGFLTVDPREEELLRPLYERVFKRAMTAQYQSDLADAKKLYTYIGAQLLSKITLDYKLLQAQYDNIKGHEMVQYFHNVGLLPNIIFEGARTYNTSEGVKYLGFAKNQFVEYPEIQNHILGFIFYPAKDEFKYSNKIMVY